MPPIADLDILRSMPVHILGSGTSDQSNHESNEIVVRCDIALQRHRGPVTISPKNDTTRFRTDVKYLDVMRKNDNGEWKIYIHSSSPNQ